MSARQQARQDNPSDEGPRSGSDLLRAVARLLAPVRRLGNAFFRHDVAVRRAEDGVHIELRQRNPAPTGREEAQLRREKQELELMLVQLAELLGELPDTRQAMRHIGFVEQALVRKGLRALHKLPLDVLQKALEQLEGLVTNWSPVGLASLRSKMAVAIIDREHADPEAEADAYRTAAVLDNEVAVTPSQTPEALQRSDDDALAAAYAALGSFMPTGPAELQSELKSASALAIARASARPGATSAQPVEIRLRELET